MKHNWKVGFVIQVQHAQEKLNHFFRSRKNYECTNKSYDYFNLNTGVIFSFSFNNENNVVSLKINLGSSNSNTIREAINEISTLTKKFQMKICYPDNDLIEEDFIISRFIQKWHEIKRDYLDFHYDTVKFPIPSREIKTAWYWNYSCQWTERFLKNLFKIPKIQFFNKYGKAHSIVDVSLNEWSAIPVAEFYRLSCTKSKNLFRLHPETIETVVSFKEFEEILSECRFLPFEKTPFFKFRPEEFKTKTKSFFSQRESIKVKTIEPSKIIDQEIFDGNKIKSLEESTY